ncbi:histidyl-tRNA synthetase [Bacilli bacterium PM5-3]|nr:histidyl-tRNA synthetase [Bacilli bacterium PM5-3]MDH6603016.1 histidyl-tRNA synthetase [Bacilli bacterium PM5-9]
MEKISKPRGTEDLLFDDTRKWQIMEDIIRKSARKYNFQEMRTPIFESTNLFVKGVGETTDVVNKEMYTFADKKGRSLTLRPEGTTGAIRAYIEHKMFGYDNQPVKLFYMGPMFRYERPQKGRQRQFHQFGVETLGIKSAQVDAEVILVGLDVCKNMGLKNLKVLINTLGDDESRLKYREKLIEYFSQYTDEMCSDCKTRLEKNPLRLLDCKIDHDKEFMKNAPKLSDSLNKESADYFAVVLEILKDLDVEYEIDESLVRGLDYYTDTIFEIVSTNKESGAQATLFGGGRYDGLVASLGGPDVSGIGFGMGMERMLISAQIENPELFDNIPLDVYVMPLVSEASSYCFEILEKLRANGIEAEMEYFDKSIKAMFKYCERNGIKKAIIVGESELENKTIIFKDLENNTQEELNGTWLEIVLERINK